MSADKGDIYVCEEQLPSVPQPRQNYTLEDSKKWRYIFFFINSVLLVLPISLIFLVLALEKYWKYFAPFLAVYTDMPGMAIFFGCCSVSVIALFGYFVNYKHKNTAYIWYGMGLVVMMFFEIELILSGYLYAGIARESVSQAFSSGIHRYSNSSRLQQSVDRVQLTLQCCGKDSYEDWFDTETGFIPASCCPLRPPTAEEKYCEGDSLNMFRDPCLPKLAEVPVLGVRLIYYFVAMMIFIKIILLLLTCKLGKMSKDLNYQY